MRSFFKQNDLIFFAQASQSRGARSTSGHTTDYQIFPAHDRASLMAQAVRPESRKNAHRWRLSFDDNLNKAFVNPSCDPTATLSEQLLSVALHPNSIEA